MNTTENTKLIAEFMGWTLDDKYLNSYRKFNSNTFKYSLLSDLKYHSDWNWLMDVVGKIENFGFEFFIVESRCKIAHNTDNSIETIIGFEITGRKIEATYNACVEFIKWYNKQ